MCEAAAMIRALLALCAVAGICAACGESDGGEAGGEAPAPPAAAEPSDWVENVCTSLVGWRSDLQGSSEELQQSAPDLSNPEEARTVLSDFLDDAVTRTEQLLTEIGDAGAPDVEQGSAISTDLQAALRNARDVLADARAGAEELPTDDPVAFGTGAQELAGSIQDGLNDVGQTFTDLNERYDAPEIEEAFQSSDACTELQ
jgi:hypothetical protein